MMGKKGTVMGAVLLSLMLLVSGCGGQGEQKSSENSKPAASDTGKPASSDTGTAKPADAKPADAKPASGTYIIVQGESKASYEVKEVFLVDSLNATAVGTTTAVTGDLALENGAFKGSKVVVDVTKLKSDKGMRDNVLKDRGLQTAKYGTAEFAVTGVEGGPVSLVEGQELSFKLTGTAKIHGVEKPLTWEARAKVEGDTLKLTATTDFKMELFGIEAPNIAGKIRVDDGVKLKVDFVAKKG